MARRRACCAAGQEASPLNTRYRLGLPLLVAMLVLVGWASARGLQPSPGGRFCYLHGAADHTLTWVSLHDFDPRTNETTLGRSRTLKVDAISLQPRTGLLYGVDSHMEAFVSYLGTFDLASGAFRPLPEPIGTGHGVLGPVIFHDISGLAFDPVTNWLYAVQIETGIGVPDALLRLDPATGRHVPGAFGGADYAALVPLPAYPHLWDVDDLAIDPATGQMYGIVNNSNAGDRLVRIDKATGALTDVGAFGIGEVEGLDFDPHGQLWATAGGTAGTPANTLYAVDKDTGIASQPRLLDNSNNYEALACQVGAPDLTLDASERGRPAQAGEPLVFTLRYANLGNAPALGAALTHTVPAGASFDAALSSPGWRPAQGEAGVYVYDLGAVPPGQRGVVNFSARLRDSLATGGLVTSAGLAHDLQSGFDLNPSDNAATVRFAP